MLAGGALRAAAQTPPKVARIGYLALHPLGSAPQETAYDFLQGLRELGYVENQNLVVDFRNGGGRAETLVHRARELVATKPDVIVAYGAVDVQAVLQATRTIPVVMIYAPDPVALGFAASLARPGGNVTGLSRLAPELTAKRLELLREVRPGLARVAVLWDLGLGPIDRLDQLGWRNAGAMQSLASGRLSLPVREPKDLDAAFATAQRGGAGAVVLGPESALLRAEVGRITALSIRYQQLTIAERDIYAKGGILLAYGPDLHEMARRAATFVDKILRGTPPGEIAIEQPTKFKLAINVKTAKALSVAIPQSMLLRADEVIQ